MYYLEKRLEVAGSHKLNLDYESKCQNIHGHNWIITIFCKRETLDNNGMIIDFTKIKEIVMSLDHADLTDKIKIKYFPDMNTVDIKTENPTAENIAKYLCQNIPYCYKVKVQESEGNIVIYEI